MPFRIARDFPWCWGLWWLLLPNLAFIAMWPIGGPHMGASMALCGGIAVLLSGWAHHPARTMTAAALFALNLMIYIALSFNLDFAEMLGSIEFAGELNPIQSPEYLVAGVLLASSLAALVLLGRRIPPLTTRPHKILALGLVALLIDIDMVATAGTRGSYMMSAPGDAPIDSAVIQNDIAPSRIAARNLVIIVVESWGLSSDPFDRRLSDRIWNPARWSERYEVTRGRSRYYGSTTNAELRELCAVWSDYNAYDFDQADCLPQKFRAAGFQVEAIHSFNEAFFDRAEWYPKIGFDHQLFAKELVAMGAGTCGGVFAGACDRDIPRLIGQRLRQAPDTHKFLYWLTLNGHIPVPADRAMGTDNCQLGNAAWRDDYPMLCRSFALQQQLADSITAEIMQADFPDTDILIVGDHMPPFFRRDLRVRFDHEHVPWIMLRSRTGVRDTAPKPH